jgi:branched-chain amino acid transport system permease protein
MITGKLMIEQLLNGLVLGCMYAAVASGLTLIWGTMRLINFAHGEFYMIAGYVLYFAITVSGLHPMFALLLAVALVFILAILVQRLAIRPLFGKPGWDVNALLVTIGLSVLLQNLALKIWGERVKTVPYFFDGTLEVFGYRMAYQRIFIFVVTAAVMLGFWGFLKKAKFGLGLRATAEDRDAATIIGINAKKIYTVTFSVSCALAAIAAVLLAPIFLVNPWMGHVPLLKGFITVVLGGLGSFQGAILGGILLGTIESISVVVFSSEWKDVVAFIILIMVLWFKPSGLFGVREW